MPALVALVELAADALLQVVADVALAHSSALGQIHGGDLLVNLVRGGEGVLDHADLRAVAVGDDDLVALLDEAEEGMGGVAHGLDLLDGVVAEGVAAKGDDNTIGLAKRLRHCWNPFCKRPTTH